MAITRARLAFRVPWRRGTDAPSASATQAGSAPASDPGWPVPAPADGSRGRRLPPRGPDGRFIRSSTGAGLSRDAVAEWPRLAAGVWEPAAQRATTPLAIDVEPAANLPVRVVLIEDVPEVAAHVREMLRSQGRFRLVHVVTDGRRAVDMIRELGPDVVLVDALLQGKVSGRDVAERLRAAGSPAGIVAMTVPTHPLDKALSAHADAVVTLPLGTIDLGRGISDAHAAAVARNPAAGSRIVAVFSAKGGVGKTTIAYNLAASLASTGLRTLLIDGNLQFGDIRRLLRVDPAAPSICDLPTDLIRGSDIADTVVADASGVEVLLAPPRPELADLVSARDLERVLDQLRRTYQAIVIDTASSLGEPTLAFLDAADLIIDVLTADAATLDLTRMMAITFAEVGYPASKVRYLVNRFDTVGAVPVSQVTRALGREPDHTVASDWQLVSGCNAEGIPFVVARPGAAASTDLRRVAEDIRALAVAPLDVSLRGQRGGRGAAVQRPGVRLSPGRS